MTTTTQEQQQSRLGFFTGLILLLIPTIIIGFDLINNLDSQTSTFAAMKPIPQIQYQQHSVEKHGEDALAVRKCLNDKGGVDEIWRIPDRKTFYPWCQLQDGRWGFMTIIQNAIDHLWYENTSFVKGDGTRDALLKYMQKFGTRFNGPFPWQ